MSYKIIQHDNNVPLTVSLPEDMLKDLVLRAEENGRTMNVEIMLRLARTLEKDLAMEDADAQAQTGFHWSPNTSKTVK